MEQLRQIGEVLGSLKALMVFRDEIRINQRQCCLLVDVFALAFESIAEEIRQNLRFDERLTKWGALESPLKELHRIFREGEHYIRHCLETKDWWAKAVSLSQNADCLEFHIRNLLWCVPVVLEAVENVGEITGCDQETIQKKRIVFSKKYEQEWMDPKLFQHKFGKCYLISPEMCTRYESAWKEDSWILSESISEKRSAGPGVLAKEESHLADLLLTPRGKLFPSSVLVGSKDYHVRRRLGHGGQYKEIQWMGEGFALRHLFGPVEPLASEITLLSSVTHPNILHVMYAFSDEERKECFLVTELMSNKLSGYIKEICSSRRRVPFPVPVAVDIMLQIARGMEYLHSRKIYHGNLNPSNILVKSRNSALDGYLHIKITGFGLRTSKNSKASTNQAAKNTCIWYASEVLTEQEQSSDSSTPSKYTEKADVYSFGMICFELLTGKIPFEDDHLQGNNMSRNIRAGERPLFPFPSPKYLTNLTKRCWLTDPSQRPGFSSICRILRYIKRFLIMNPDHSNPNPPTPMIDYFDIEASLSKRFTTWTRTEVPKVFEIPFQMFAYRAIERERSSLNPREKSSESGSEGTSACGEENVFPMIIQEDVFNTPLSSPVCSLRSSSNGSAESNKKSFMKKVDGKGSKQLGNSPKARAVRPPHLLSLRAHSLRVSSESELRSVVMSPGRRRISGHASDSELA